MVNLTQLAEFLQNVHRNTFASGDTKLLIKEPDQSTSISFTDGDWEFKDNYFGGEPYGGRETVYYKGAPLFMIAYYGTIVPEYKDISGLYAFLQTALRNCPLEMPLRGPENFSEGELSYEFQVHGDLEEFLAFEIIRFKGEQVYSAKFIGGIVDRRQEN